MEPAPAQNRVIEFRNPDHPWPDRPEIPELVLDDPFDFDEEEVEDRHGPPSEGDVSEQTILLLRRQCLFRWAAHSVAIAISQLPEVLKVVAFGSVARPLTMEVPRFRQFRRYRREMPHECADLDLAVWLADLSRLKELKNAMSRGLSQVQDTPYGGVAHHQVDVHVFDAEPERYRGRLCIFGRCPKPGKRECFAPGCGAQPFLQQYANYRFHPAQFEAEPKVTLFDRAGNFLVRPPSTDVTPTRFARRAKREDEDPYDDDIPF